MRPQTTALALALQTFLIDRQARRYTPRTLDFYRDRLRPFVTWCEAQGVTEIDQLRAAHVRAYLVLLQDSGLAAATVHSTARAVKAFCNFAVAEGMIAASPMAAVGMPKLPKTTLPSLTAEDVRKLLNAADRARDKALVLFLLDTGLRAVEIANLEGRDVDMDAGAVHVRLGKGQKDRTVYIGAKTRRALLRYWREVYSGLPSGRDPVWLNERTGEGLTHWGVRAALRRLGEHAGVEHSNPHTFRRTFALWSLRAGMSIYHLQRLMGHEDLQMLRLYLPLVEGDMQEAHKQHGPVDHMSKN